MFFFNFFYWKYIKMIDLCFGIFELFSIECIPKHSVTATTSQGASGQRNPTAL